MSPRDPPAGARGVDGGGAASAGAAPARHESRGRDCVGDDEPAPVYATRLPARPLAAPRRRRTLRCGGGALSPLRRPGRLCARPRARPRRGAPLALRPRRGAAAAGRGETRRRLPLESRRNGPRLGACRRRGVRGVGGVRATTSAGGAPRRLLRLGGDQGGGPRGVRGVRRRPDRRGRGARMGRRLRRRHAHRPPPATSPRPGRPSPRPPLHPAAAALSGLLLVDT